MIRSITIRLMAVTLVLGLASADLAAAGSVSKTVPFQLDQWFELDATDGPVTLHRIRIRQVQGGLTKSKLFRPGNDEYLETIQIELEYSNDSDRDWEADLDIRWLDADGNAIDGYHDDEGLDEDERRDETTVTLSTLRYGLERAASLEIGIEFERD